LAFQDKVDLENMAREFQIFSEEIEKVDKEIKKKLG